MIGGGVTFLTFKPCCDKLKASLRDTILSNPDDNPARTTTYPSTPTSCRLQKKTHKPPPGG